MKKYLFGLGAMIVGAGLMFVLMHGEVSAEGEPGIMNCKIYENLIRLDKLSEDSKKKAKKQLKNMVKKLDKALGLNNKP